MKVKSLSHVRLLVTPWTAAYQAPPSMGFSRQEYWSGVPLPSLCSMLVSCIMIHQERAVADNIAQTYLDIEHFFLACSLLGIGEGNGTPLQYSCLESPMDGEAWWAAVHGVTKSRT